MSKYLLLKIHIFKYAYTYTSTYLYFILHCYRPPTYSPMQGNTPDIASITCCSLTLKYWAWYSLPWTWLCRRRVWPPGVLGRTAGGSGWRRRIHISSGRSWGNQNRWWSWRECLGTLREGGKSVLRYWDEICDRKCILKLLGGKSVLKYWDEEICDRKYILKLLEGRIGLKILGGGDLW